MIELTPAKSQSITGLSRLFVSGYSRLFRRYSMADYYIIKGSEVIVPPSASELVELPSKKVAFRFAWRSEVRVQKLKA